MMNICGLCQADGLETEVIGLLVALGCLHPEVAWMPRRGTLHKTHLIFAWNMSLEKANQRF
jgi:hypothetical protein